MYYFINDYSEGACEEILDALVRTNRVQTCGYGMDEYCEKARNLIRKKLNHPSEIHFLVGGTQTNFTAIAALLRPHQGVIASVTGHVNTHESGAIEATGHKVLAVPTSDGKLTAQMVQDVLAAHFADVNAEHMVQPGMVYISHPTELGTLYSKKELQELRAVCREYDIPFYVDGARLGCALTCPETDVTLEDLAELTDLFYIGGTKMGALFGEALVINTPQYNKDFRYIQKQRGGMLAKGRLLGIQFTELFRENLYFDLAKHANEMAYRLRDGMKKMGYSFLIDSPTNQIFPIISKEILQKLGEEFEVGFWEPYDDTQDVVRLCTSWATKESMVELFLQKLAECSASHSTFLH